MNSQDVLNKLRMPTYKTLPLLYNGKTQTISGVYFPFNPFISNAQQHIVTLSDNDKIVLIENTPKIPQPSKRILLLLHGLTGSENSRYLIRVTHRFTQAGFTVFRMNLRGCGLGAGLAKHPYHSGRSEDTREVLNFIAKRYPESPITQIGFSLGANITLKMAGENVPLPHHLDSVMAISPPLDLDSTVKLLIKKRNKIFNTYFMNGLIRDAKLRSQFFPEDKLPIFTKNMNVYDFDDIYTAPRCGFQNAKDYYTQCSSAQFISQITLPTFILYAKDDPFITRRSFLSIPKKSNFDTIITQKGGHMGWLGYTDKAGDFRWMDNIIVKWVLWHDGATTHKQKDRHIPW